jgi:hypothetical protein
MVPAQPRVRNPVRDRTELIMGAVLAGMALAVVGLTMMLIYGSMP